MDVLISHEGLHGERYGTRTCQAKGVERIIYATRPALVLHGNYNTTRYFMSLNSKVISIQEGEVMVVRWENKKISIL